MNYEGIVRQYLNDLYKHVEAFQATGESTPELSYRPVLDKFLSDVSTIYSSSVDIIFEPRLQGHAGRPDWRLYNTEE